MPTISDAIKKDHREMEQYYNEVKNLLKEFQNLSASQPEYVPKLNELWHILSAQIDEEKNDLPKLESAPAKTEGASESMAKKFGLTNMENPIFESAMGLLAAPLDHIADLFRKGRRLVLILRRSGWLTVGGL
ncbi:hypothetical protein B0H63DRAFT_492638 [Podospora didyma]|uniref:Hemerythrin-like domain-containing protein n=1 Tax=Podospora didyma TaxID=330526 RepID=A0AAE0NYF9_9PEZI|nr:hypothetical protein B0H63DRAFT_492638 [Podospora didyma]